MTEVGSETGIEIRVSRCCGAIPFSATAIRIIDGEKKEFELCSKCYNTAEFDLQHEWIERKARLAQKFLDRHYMLNYKGSLKYDKKKEGKK